MLNQDSSYQKMNRKAANVLKVCAGLDLEIKEEAEVVNMCKAWDDHKLSGIREGLEEGIREGRKEGIKEGIKEGEMKSVRKMALKLHNRGDAAADISDLLEVPEVQIKEWILETEKV